ncbi:MAG: RloB family protein [Butyricicoccus sp.]|nr:RloB family protein [Butyricicoccus sp.]
MAISHRLRSYMNKRPDEGMEENPRRIVFLSVEGNVTEKNYLDYVNKFRIQLGINSVVHIETLSRGADTRSDPKSVLGLLEDYLEIRDEGILPEDINSVLIEAGEKSCSLEQIEQYLNGKLDGKDSSGFKRALRLAGIDLDYQKFLSEYNGKDDCFGVVIDRDCGNHTEKVLKELQEKCAGKKNCYCFITNPCFEFWLLLHVCDVENEYEGRYEEILKNEKKSSKHTFMSKELSERAGHSKRISEKKFTECYLPNVNTAIERSKKFEQTDEGLLQNVGTNLPTLFQILREEL